MIDKINQFNLLHGILRKNHRKNIKINYKNLPFIGQDIWTIYELSWLNLNGLPKVSIAIIEFDISSKKIIESKSLKIYLNNLNQKKFKNSHNLIKQIESDLKKCVLGNVSVKLFDLNKIKNMGLSKFNGICIDNNKVIIKSYTYNKLFLKNSAKKRKIVTESLYSNLFKSNCPITQQPDWASINIIYTGQKINHSALLKYLVSFRTHNEFHEECIERIFNDIQTLCKPEKLSVYARYNRRGGIDINPWRSNTNFKPYLIRLSRQ
ncbi:NADPH-dependent 7-cyano-7-deazaguanine reductase [Buchnera aphidicola (Protaphis terricola)]|uniref:NADPH-dependent 7-cyano-7-deazaguanine reductase QueF n=1 Tax=Buchnera aphidicola TaxID=9 RepID=UPI0034639E5D